MASFDLSLDDSSPLITYSPATAWSDSPDGDSLIPEYSGGSLHTTSAQGASATINFSGTAFFLYRGVRPNYGTYSVTLDGQTILSDGNANRPEPAVKQLLASAENLEHKEHSLVVTNTGTSPIDIDSLDIKCEIGGPGSKMTVTNYDDSDSRITYLPSPSDWNTNSGESFMDNTLHFSQAPNAGASLTFAGDAIALYGTVSPDHANIRVTIDGREQTLTGGAGGITSALHTQTLLWYADKLGQQEHTLVVNSEQGDGTGPFLDIDRFAVFAATPASTIGATDVASPTGVTSSSRDPTSKPSAIAAASRGAGLPIAAIIVIVIGCLLALATIVGAILFVRRRRRIRTERDLEGDIVQPSSPSLPFQEKIESPVVPRPTYEQPPMSERGTRNSVVSRGSMSSMIIPFYAEARGSSDHSRTGSISSTAQLIPSDVPTIRVPKPPRAAIVSRAPVMYQIPARPTQRPPPLDYQSFE